MADRKLIRQLSVVVLLTMVGSAGAARKAAAQGFISPFVGYNFGGDSGCPEITNCEDKRIDYGVSVGALGSIVGFEAEYGYTKDFFGETSVQTSSVTTIMGNFLLAPRFGPVQPYGLGGVGLIRTVVSGGDDQNQIGYDVGGGLFVFFAKHVGIRGDVRYFHSFQAFDFGNLPANLPDFGLRGEKVDFGRASIAVVFRF